MTNAWSISWTRFRPFVHCATWLCAALVWCSLSLSQIAVRPVWCQAPIITPPRPDPVRDAFARSFDFERQLKYKEAVESLLALGHVPDQQYVIDLRLGWLHYANADYPTAIRYYQSAVRLAPDATEPRVGLLLPLLAAQLYPDAVRVAREVLRIDPVNYYAKVRLAYALRLSGELDEAEQVCLQMLQLRPTDLTFLAELGLTLAAKKNDAGAQATFNKLLTLDPYSFVARQQLGLPPLAPPTATPLAPAANAESATLPATQLPLTTNDPNAGLPPVWSSPEPEFKIGVLPSVAWISYGSQSIKRDGLAVGVYAFSSFVNMFEISADYTHLGFRNGTTLDQQDYTAVYTFLEVENWKLRLGGHAIASTDDFGNGSWIAFTGLHFYQTEVWDTGIDYYYSHYQDATTSLDVNQLTPHIAVEHRFLNGLKMRLDTLGYWINTGNDLGLGTRTFYSMETRWRLDGDALGIGLFAWTGKQTFAVRRDGFIVFNLGEEHRGGYGGEINWRLGENTWITFRATEELFADFVTGIGTHQFVAAGLFSHTF